MVAVGERVVGNDFHLLFYSSELIWVVTITERIRQKRQSNLTLPRLLNYISWFEFPHGTTSTTTRPNVATVR